MFEERAAQPDRTGGQSDGEVALLEAGADLRGGRHRGAPMRAAPDSGRKFQRADRKKRTAWAHGLYAEPAHEIAEVLSGGPLFHPTPTVGAVETEFGERTHQHGVLGDAGVREQFGVQHDAPLLVEAEGLRLREEPRREILTGAVGQSDGLDLGAQLGDLGGRQDGDVTVRMRSSQKLLPFTVRRTPRRRNRDTILVVEGVPEKAGVGSCAKLDH